MAARASSGRPQSAINVVNRVERRDLDKSCGTPFAGVRQQIT
ncbi:MAG: hypothetical protein WA655_16460 [Candidatus Korobacteraceae bacterium]